MRANVVGMCKKFIKEVLNKEGWFIQLVESKNCDLLILTGTALEQVGDKFSDIDIFLVCKYEAQIKYFLKPVNVFRYKQYLIEISIVSTEKLFNDVYNKGNIYWWSNSCIIKSYNEEAEKAFYQANHLTKREYLDRLWTNFVCFNINSFDINKQIKREEPLSVKLLFNENIKLIIDSELTCKLRFPSWKQFGRVLKKVNNDLYNEILQYQNFNDFKELSFYNMQLKKHITNILKNNGFTKNEINNWENCNLEKITFQYI
jgi:hypothetical protein